MFLDLEKQWSEVSQIPLTKMNRRQFVGRTAAGALLLGVPLSAPRADDHEEVEKTLENMQGGDATPSLFIALHPDGQVDLTCHRSEMGQQSWTSMAQLIAEELEADFSRVNIVQAIGHPRYGDQNTDGSRSVRYNFTRLRTAGAAMRLMLERAAAEHFGVESGCTANDHYVVHTASGRRVSFGELAERASGQAIPSLSEVKLKTRDQWRYIGKPTPSLTVPKITRGQGEFGIDVQLPDMVHAVIARPPQVLGKPGKVDDAKSRDVPGFLRTVRLPDASEPVAFKPLGGIAVVAKDTYAAIAARRVLSVEWDTGPNAQYDSADFEKAMTATARQPGAVKLNRGDANKALESATRSVTAEYYAPHLAQAPMEPPVATARWEGNKVECWACTQTPQASRRTVAQVCGVPEDNVTINVTWLGGGFGRKSKPDYVVEAALIAREIGQPVKVTWTREDDLQHGYFHSVSAQRFDAALDDDGRCTALRHRTVFPPIPSTFAAGADDPSWGELGLGATDNPFAVPNLRLESGRAKAHVRIGWLRAVANVYHAFGVQSFASELAAEAGRDPRDYLLELIGPDRLIDPNNEGAEYSNYGSPMADYPIDTARLKHVARKASDMANWGRELPEGHGLGIAVHRSFVSYVATVVEVAVTKDGALTIPGVWSAIDAGTVVNTRHTESQVEGGTLYGLSNALYGEMTAKDGAIVQANFPAWRIMRMNEAPRRMQVHIVESDAPPGGVGEPPTPPAAPALANAIFAATGVRYRRLPIMGASATTLPRA
ncbi:MAG: molybdopterin cofactor-binding domain-containing protein [Gammaproteobacteria bacterium]